MFRKDAKTFFDTLARTYPGWKNKNKYYYSKLTELYKKNVLPGKNVLEIGCRDGSLLNALEPEKGVGLDVSEDLIEIAKKQYPHLTFSVIKDKIINIEEQFDYVVICNTIGYVSDLMELFEQIQGVLKPDGKIIIVYFSPLIEPILKLGEILGLKSSGSLINRFYVKDIINLLDLANFETKEWGYTLSLPKYIPLISELINRCFPYIKILRNFGFIQYVIAQPGIISQSQSEDFSEQARKELSCSVIIPCYNEEGNIKECIERVPSMGRFTEIIVVDDGSADSTADVVKKVKIELPDADIRLISYSPNKGKGFAVRKGFEEAKGDVLMILDADMTVPPEELARFFKPLAEGKAQAVNGARMIYMMEEEAMSYLHMFGNKVFSIIFTYLIGQRLTDTLCGTKVILKQDYNKMNMGRCPWGDFDILLGVAKLNLKLVEIPVHYMSRKAGSSKMKAFRHGLILLKMCCYGFRELKLKPWLRFS